MDEIERAEEQAEESELHEARLARALAHLMVLRDGASDIWALDDPRDQAAALLDFSGQMAAFALVAHESATSLCRVWGATAERGE